MDEHKLEQIPDHYTHLIWHVGRLHFKVGPFENKESLCELVRLIHDPNSELKEKFALILMIQHSPPFTKEQKEETIKACNDNTDWFVLATEDTDVLNKVDMSASPNERFQTALDNIDLAI